MDFEPVEFPASGGVSLSGWFLNAESTGTVVFCPGNSGNLSSHLLYLELARRAGLSVLGFDYRGFGRSGGTADVRFLSEDVLAACRFVTARRGRDAPIALFGVSLGALAALAAAAAARSGRVEALPVSALAVEGLSDVKDLLEGVFRHGSFGPVRVRSIRAPGGDLRERRRPLLLRTRPPSFLAAPLAGLFSKCYPFEGKRPGRSAPLLGKLPVLIIHGVEDEVLPFEAAIDVYAALTGPRRLWLIPGAGHAQEPALSHGVEYSQQLREFFGSSLSPAPPSQRGSGPAGSPPGGARARLVTVLSGDSLEQSLIPAGVRAPETAGARAGNLLTEIEVRTLAGDGFPRQELDPLSARYRACYRDPYRRMVRAVNSMDLKGLDSALGEYLALPRELPFDLLAASYCLRIAVAGIRGVPGWPRCGHDLVSRSLTRFRDLWDPHPGLPGRDCPESPLNWVERARAKRGDRRP